MSGVCVGAGRGTWGLGSGYWDSGLGLGLWIRDWGPLTRWGLGLGTGDWIVDWGAGVGIGLGSVDCGLYVKPAVNRQPGYRQENS